MKTSPFLAAALSLTFMPSAKAGDTLVQVSTIDALVKGLFDGGVSFGELRRLGDFGIGTLDNLDGEMLALDGKFYQITSDGAVHDIPDSKETPFSEMTFFKADKTLPLQSADSLASLQKQLDAATPSGNLFYAVKIAGTFSVMSTRSVPRQQPPFVTLPEAAKSQSVFKMENITGTLVGFRCPDYVKGINVPGYHFHFISADRKQGGHVLECSLASGEAEIDTLENLKMLLPQDEAFLKADLSTHDAKGLEAVEKGKPAE